MDVSGREKLEDEEEEHNFELEKRNLVSLHIRYIMCKGYFYREQCPKISKKRKTARPKFD